MAASQKFTHREFATFPAVGLQALSSATYPFKDASLVVECVAEAHPTDTKTQSCVAVA